MKRTTTASLLLAFAFTTAPATAQLTFTETPVPDYSTYQESFGAVRAAECNGDGLVDLIATKPYDNSIVIWYNLGNGSYSTSYLTAVQNFSYARDLSAADLNGDGLGDFVSASPNDYDVSVFLNRGAAANYTYEEKVLDTSFPGAWSVHFADMDSDGDLDVVAGAGDAYVQGVRWYENVDVGAGAGTGDGTQWSGPHTLDATVNEPIGVFGADLDNDGDTDVLVASWVDDSIYWYENDGAQSFTQHTLRTNYPSANSVHAADVNGDGALDLLTTCYGNEPTWQMYRDPVKNPQGGLFSLWLTSGGTHGSWNEFIPQNANGIAYYNGARYAWPADFDGDGDQDIATCASVEYVRQGTALVISADVSYWENQNNSYWDQYYIASNFRGVRQVTVGDLDSDEHIDMAAAGLGDYVSLRNGGLRGYVNGVQELSNSSTFPRNTYVMIGIPSDATTGDPNTLFSDDLGGTAAGSSTWRMSRWSVADSQYVRFGESDERSGEPVLELGDPAPMAPGRGYWFIQDYADVCTLQVEESLYAGDGVVDTTTYYPISIDGPSGDNRGLNQLANPYPWNYDFSKTYVAETGNLSIRKTLADAVQSNWISGTMAYWNPSANQYQPVNFSQGENVILATWQGFWIEQTHSSKSLTLMLTPRNGVITSTASMGPGARIVQAAEPKSERSIQAQTGESWIAQLAVRTGDATLIGTDGRGRGTGSAILSDAFNSFGLDAGASDGYDGLDAPVFELKNPSLYFNHPEWQGSIDSLTLGKYYDGDVRKADNAVKELDLRFLYAFGTSNGVTVDETTSFTLSVLNPEDIPAGRSVTLHDGGTGDLLADFGAGEAFVFKHDEVTTATRTDDSGNPVSAVADFTIRIEPVTAGVAEEEAGLIRDYELMSLYPNPFNPVTTATVFLPEASPLKAKVFDVLGRKVATLTDRTVPAGTHRITFDGSSLSSGVYFIRVQVPGHLDETRKVVLMK